MTMNKGIARGKPQKRAVDVVLETTERFLNWPDEHPGVQSRPLAG